ncbi:MAG: HEAT repeat domain-containing protein [Thermoanaerobaculia bacterium]|nr:HEAT repeat domain-containing protein [Thermoanaerobaculia bacterium]
MTPFIEFTSLLQRAVKGVQLYGSTGHAKAREALDQLAAQTGRMLAGTPRLQIVVSQNRIFVDGQLLREHNPTLKWFTEQLMERRLNGFVMAHGITPEELERVVQILVLKPQKLADSGGAAQLLSEIDASHVRLSHVRYEEVREGEIVVPEDALIGDGSASGGVALGPAAGFGGGGGTGNAAGGPGIGVGQGGGFPDLPDGPMTEEEAVRQLTALTQAWTGNAQGGETTDGDATGSGRSLPRTVRFQTFAANVSTFLREQSVDLIRLRSRLSDMGVSKDELEELLHAISWERLGTEERIAKMLEQNLIFELPSEKVLSFILELIRLERASDAARLIEKLGTGLFAESHETRRSAADSFIRIATWGTDPGLPAEIEALVDKILLTHFVRESDPHIHERSVLAFENLYDSWIAREQIPKAYQILRKLEGASAAGAAQAPWKGEAFGQLATKLTSAPRMKTLLAKMYARDGEVAASTYHPLLTLFGERAAQRLLEALAEEEDRGRRGRLVKAVKSIGKPALQSLHEATKSPTWYLVRNALNLIGDLVAVDLADDAVEALAHDDDRVRKAAARALGKLGGLRAEKQLGDALASNEPETQMEILAALAAMKGDTAIPQIAELTKKRIGRGDDSVRLRAIEVLGQIGSAAAIAPLTDLLRKKGLLGGGESNEIRAAAAKALAALNALGLQEARQAADAIIGVEGDGTVRKILQRSTPAKPPRE